jgi:hypothetical protein
MIRDELNVLSFGRLQMIVVKRLKPKTAFHRQVLFHDLNGLHGIGIRVGKNSGPERGDLLGFRVVHSITAH